ncbi:response regulator transcription factor [Stackebrandtia nassauensis]|uniref:Two component transcriptional regulator, LuxR family n=1 Tax=Stackebrandtia nassauensis (strain DSM 44728 / CIP 108903 / NRRL B-16338 / NBRC 102104 / LLR-40K-21) TaxID=446470 RepID=D3Q5R9_STANL|nr:response regulator transcription factor [Stackebrandtia nassauensis]ADD40218.1 two component transcriptional regulator, LuxR family [Stackebrandtia nassauensis DSM 44728]
MTIRILVADDEAMLRGALVALLDLESDLDVVAEVDTSTAAVTATAESRPDIAVLDLEMPPADGLVAAEQILRQPTPPRIVLVTRHARPGVLRRALAAGVSAFVPKTTPAERLAEIIRDVHSGRRYVDPDIAASALTEDECPLTTRELEVLRAARTGASIADIAAAVHLAPGTVRNYLSSAMTKLGVSSRHAAAHAAWEQGWI